MQDDQQALRVWLLSGCSCRPRSACDRWHLAGRVTGAAVGRRDADLRACITSRSRSTRSVTSGAGGASSSDESRNVWLLGLLVVRRVVAQQPSRVPQLGDPRHAPLRSGARSGRLGDHRAREARLGLEGRAHPARAPGFASRSSSRHLRPEVQRRPARADKQRVEVDEQDWDDAEAPDDGRGLRAYVLPLLLVLVLPSAWRVASRITQRRTIRNTSRTTTPPLTSEG